MVTESGRGVRNVGLLARWVRSVIASISWGSSAGGLAGQLHGRGPRWASVATRISATPLVPGKRSGVEPDMHIDR